MFRGGLSHVKSALAIDIEREIAIGLAAVHIGVGGGENNPVWPMLPDCLLNLFLASHISFAGAESG